MRGETAREGEAREIGMKNAECRGGTFTKKTKRGRKGVCLSGWLTGIMMAAVLDPFLLERDPFEYLLPDGRGRVSWRKDRSLTERYARALTQSPAPP